MKQFWILDFRFWIEPRENKPMSPIRSKCLSDNRKSKACGEYHRTIKNLKLAGLLALIVTLTIARALAEAQPASKVYRIGFLLTTTTDANRPRAILERLRERGYVEGQNLVVEQSDKVKGLVGRKVDVIVVFGTTTALDAKKATSTIPIVMTSSANPIQNGLIASLARPGGNVTGMTSLSGELGGKRLEVFKDAVPRLSRVVIPAPARSSTEDAFIKETEPAARALKIQLIRVAVRGPEDYEEIFNVAKKERADGLLTRLPPATTPAAQRKQLVDLAAKHRLPAIYEGAIYVEEGGLMSYSPDIAERFQRTAVMVDKILKGANPADIPVEQPTKFEFVINLKTAKQIGLTIPPNVLARADRIIR
jgi:putative ABC transport system substrate-binding protein